MKNYGLWKLFNYYSHFGNKEPHISATARYNNVLFFAVKMIFFVQLCHFHSVALLSPELSWFQDSHHPRTVVHLAAVVVFSVVPYRPWSSSLPVRDHHCHRLVVAVVGRPWLPSPSSAVCRHYRCRSTAVVIINPAPTSAELLLVRDR